MTSSATTTTRKPSAKRAEIMTARTLKHRDAADRAMDGFVRTPAKLAEQMTTVTHPELGAFPRGSRVLEPSAGEGDLVRWILDHDYDVHVDAVEPNDRRAAALDKLAEEYPGRVTVWRMTFETFAERHPGTEYDAVIMNPPFGDSSRDMVWMDHLRLAWDMLRTGAQLVSVVPANYDGGVSRAHQDLRAWAGERGARFEKLDPGAFAASGCGVNAGLLTIGKALPARADGLPLWLAVPTPGEPVRVPGLPQVTAAAALALPVQEYADRNDGDTLRVIRYVGTCFVCARPLWWHDGRSDAAAWEGCTIDPAGSGKTGPYVLVCLDHASTASVRLAAIVAALPYWTEPPTAGNAPRVLPMDLCAGVYAQVSGIDWRGWDFTAAGHVLADPKDTGDGRVLVRLRMHTGGDIELSAEWDTAVDVLDVPWTDPAPARRQPAPRPAVPAPAPAPVVEPDVWGQLAATLPGL